MKNNSMFVKILAGILAGLMIISAISIVAIYFLQ